MYITKSLKTLIKSLLTSVMLLFISFSYAQSPTNTLTPFTLDFVTGISSPVGDFKNFSESGFNSGFVVNKAFCNNISIGLNTSYTTLPIKNEFGVSNEKWNSLSMSIGPLYHIDINKVFVQFYGALGLSFINIPEVIDFYPQTDFVSMNLKESNSSGLNTHFGINIGTEICSGLRFFVSTEYNTNYSGKINYQIKDFTGALDDRGRIDADLANDIPFENRDFSFSTMNINFGIRLNLGYAKQKVPNNKAGKSNSSNNVMNASDQDLGRGQAQDHNASRSNTTSGVMSNPDDDFDNEDTNAVEAQDHNASRSNTTSSVMSNPDDDFDNDDSKAVEAQDHNASRSNTTSSVMSNPDDDFDNEDTNAVEAQDHNASRSNTTSSVMSNPDDDIDNDDTKAVEAQDHNASRSNTTSGVMSNPDDDIDNEDTKAVEAQDHNASRSNTTSGVMSNPDEDMDNDDSNAVEAQDHNASRSNTTSSVMKGSGEDNDTIPLSFSKMLIEMDIDKDKKISKSEAKGDLKDNFEKRDVNKDGYVTEDEVIIRNR